jgi:hypothetical protein
LHERAKTIHPLRHVAQVNFDGNTTNKNKEGDMKNVILIIGFLSGLFLASVFAANESDYKLPVLAEGE